MPFEVRPLKEFLVKPALPTALERLPELGLNLMWSWNHGVRAIFRRLDPVAWKESNHNPVVMLGTSIAGFSRTSGGGSAFFGSLPASLRHLGYVRRVQGRPPICWSPISRWNMDCLIACRFTREDWAYFPGTSLKASSDAIVPLVGVGLAYQNGYFQQALDPDGWQQERTPVNDFYSLPMTPGDQSGWQRSWWSACPGGELRDFRQGMAHRCRPRAPLFAGYERSAERVAGVPGHHPSVVRRRSAHTHSPGNCFGDRRIARARKIAIEADGLPHERRPLPRFWRSKEFAC